MDDKKELRKEYGIDGSEYDNEYARLSKDDFDIDALISKHKVRKEQSGETKVIEIEEKEREPEWEAPVPEAPREERKPEFKTELQKNAENFKLKIEDSEFEREYSAELKFNVDSAERPMLVENMLPPSFCKEDEKPEDQARSFLFKRQGLCRIRCGLMFLTAIAAIMLSALDGKGIGFMQPIASAAHPVRYGALMILITAVAFALCYDVLWKGARGLFKGGICIESTIFLVSIVTAANNIAFILTDGGGGKLFNALTVLTLCFMLFREQSDYKKQREDFRFLHSKQQKQNTVFEKKVFKDADVVSARLAKGDRYEGFFAAAGGRKTIDRLAAPIFIVSAVFFAASFIYSIATGGNAVLALSAATFALCCGTPVTVALTDSLLWSGMAKKLRLAGAVFVGNDAVDCAANAGEVVISDRDLFGGGDVSLCGIKMYRDARIDDVIIDAASALEYLNGPLSGVLLSVIDYKTDLLKPVSKIEFDPGMGIKAYIGDSATQIGNKRYMRENGVEVEDDGIAETLETQGKNPLYVAKDGECCALISFKYQANKYVAKALAKLERMGMKLMILSDDPVITADLVKEKYQLGCEVELRVKNAGPDKKLRPSIVCLQRSITVYTRMLGCMCRIRTAQAISIAVYILSALFSFALLTVMLLSESFEQATVTVALVLQLFWVVPQLIITFVAGAKK